MMWVLCYHQNLFLWVGLKILLIVYEIHLSVNWDCKEIKNMGLWREVTFVCAELAIVNALITTYM